LILIVGGGEVDLGRLRNHCQRAIKIIAADRGADYLLSVGILPDFLIGDMDSASSSSINSCCEAAKCEIIRHLPEKDQTDGELAIVQAVTLAPEEIIFCGAIGNRIDHSMANLFCISNYVSEGVKISLESGSQEIILLAGEMRRSDWKIGDTVSLLSFGISCYVEKIAGFKYPLANKELFQSSSLGISNVIEEESVYIHIKSGMAMVVREFGKGEIG
jgi:thiamine pyrophosphokinase